MAPSGRYHGRVGGHRRVRRGDQLVDAAVADGPVAVLQRRRAAATTTIGQGVRGSGYIAP
jgi:hypothetical protein